MRRGRPGVVITCLRGFMKTSRVSLFDRCLETAILGSQKARGMTTRYTRSVRTLRAIWCNCNVIIPHILRIRGSRVSTVLKGKEEFFQKIMALIKRQRSRKGDARVPLRYAQRLPTERESRSLRLRRDARALFSSVVTRDAEDVSGFSMKSGNRGR